MNALGLNLFKQEDYAAANRSFSRVLKFDPANAEALNNKGVVLADQGRHKEAIKKYRAALEIDGKYVKAGLNLSRALEDMENFAASLEELERLADLFPADWEVRTRLAALYHKLERHDEAMDQARAILDKDPDNIQALRIEGAIQGIQGNDEEAKNIFERITNMNPVEGSGENYDRFMIESPDSRYWLDLVPPPGVVPPEPPAKPAAETRPHPGAAALAKARAAKAGAKTAAATAETAVAAETMVGTEIMAEAETVTVIETITVTETVTVMAETETAEATATEAETAGVKAAATKATATETDAKALATEATTAEAAANRAATGRVPAGDLLGLLRYLVDLAGNLPEPELGDFMRSEARAEMKRLIGDLENSRE
jgi:Flp pilus assembly protein TadD